VKVHKVDSSNIEQVGWDEETKAVHVMFKGNSKAYRYGPFSEEEFTRFLTAPSIGKHFHSAIKGKQLK
jgi:KTSC domain